MRAAYRKKGPKYADKLNVDRSRKEWDWTVSGINLGLMFCAVGLNDRFQFGAKRLKELEDYVNELFNREIESCEGDYEKLTADLFSRLERIRGKGWED